MTGFAVVTMAAAAAFAQPDAAEQDYLRRKWREDLSDPRTGLDGATLKTNLAERVKAWRTKESWPIVKALLFSNLCERTAIDVSEHDWFPTFALWTRHTDKLNPVIPLMEQRRNEIVAKYVPQAMRPRWPDLCAYADFDHSAPNWDEIIPLGFPGMKARLLANWKETDYYRARRIAAEGVLRLLDRLVAQAEKTASVQQQGGRARGQVESLRRLRAGAPRTALDVLNFIYLYWSVCEKFDGIQVRTLGNLDRLLTPYYVADLAAGRTTEAEFREQLRHFWWQWGSIDNYWGQPVYFGGTKPDGTTEFTDVSRILLEIHDELALATPKLHLKVGASTPDWVWTKAIDMVRRQRPISFIGEEPHWRVIRSLGYGEKEAREFMLWGCYEWAVRDSANDTFGAAVNVLKGFADALARNRTIEQSEQPDNFEAFKRQVFDAIVSNVVTARTFVIENERHLWEINPSMLPSLAAGYSVRTGRDVYQGGTEHGNNTGIWMIGLGTTVDALMAVREIVYGEGGRSGGSGEGSGGGGGSGGSGGGGGSGMSLKELAEIMAANWKGHEELRLRMMRAKGKWGNNDPAANALARELVKCVTEPVNRRPNSRGGVFKAHGHTARLHIEMGRSTGATPDGRRAGEEMSKNISPTMGADTEGATALVASVSNLDARDLPGDFPLDVALIPWTVAGEKGVETIRALIETYFANGGLVIQFNILDPETLRDAQRHPEKYANLQVRVCGWNVRWNDIPKVEQDKFILRQERIAQ